ncbi:MAG: hypothetical protein A2176_09555 [Spirochaetes bacterium RBG_13_51_14]|nr:MAG: hypothetical protein A2176_09555 [Spirochaetes bacterium RBG_13_51_14]
MQIKERISKLIEETAERLGYMVYETSFLLKGENSRINVKLDTLAGITLRDCETFSRELSGRLDEEEVLPNYSLEVSSPGLDRQLRSSDEFRRFSGAPVKVIYQEGAERRVAKGTLAQVTGTAVIVSSETGELEILHDTIISANLDY